MERMDMQFTDLKIAENKFFKMVRSSDYKYNFSKVDGYFERWGVTEEEDPLYAPSPELLDIEISTICHGIDNKVCQHCYKSNTGEGYNMTFETFKSIFDVIPRTLTQIAFGIGDIDGNPDLWKIMRYCRENGRNYIVPNITINGWNLTDDYARKLVDVCGAIAVSRYEPKDICYNAVKKLTDLGLKQVNIHMLVSEETYNGCLEVIRDMKMDPRLADMNAVVFLTLKQKGRGTGYNTISLNKYKKLIKYAQKMQVTFGMDSCSAFKFLSCMKGHPKFKRFETVAEPCESSLFSFYCNVDGIFFPCSFTEGVKVDNMDWREGLVLENGNFLKDIWYHPKTKAFRKKLLETTKRNELKCRECPAFKI